MSLVSNKAGTIWSALAVKTCEFMNILSIPLKTEPTMQTDTGTSLDLGVWSKNETKITY